MVYWGQFLPEAFRGFTDFSSTERPAWYLASRSMFNHIAIVEVALLYLATALFAAGLHAVKIFSTTAYHIHFGKHYVYAAKCSADGSARTSRHHRLHYIGSRNLIYYTIFNGS